MTKVTLRKIYSGKSRREAVMLFCRECMGYDGHREKKKSHVTYTEASYSVKECPSVKCPLYPYRLSKKTPVELDWL